MICKLQCIFPATIGTVYLVCRTHPNYLLCRLFTIVSSIAADNQGRPSQLVAHSCQRTLNKVFRIMLTHEDFRRLSQATCTGLLPVNWLCRNFDALQRHLGRYAGSRSSPDVGESINHVYHQTIIISHLHFSTLQSLNSAIPLLQSVTFHDVIWSQLYFNIL